MPAKRRDRRIQDGKSVVTRVSQTRGSRQWLRSPTITVACGLLLAVGIVFAAVTVLLSTVASWLPFAGPLLFEGMRIQQSGFDSDVLGWLNLSVALVLEAGIYLGTAYYFKGRRSTESA